MNKILVTREDKMKITTGRDNKMVEIGRDAIRAGFLKKLPGTSLAILLYLLTHTDNGITVKTSSETICSFLSCNLEKTNEGLKYLADNKIITFNNNGEINLHIENLRLNKQYENNSENKIHDDKLTDILQAYIPPSENSLVVKQWLQDFEPKLIQELIRRVDKWFDKQKFKQTPENRFYYLRGIINDWYEKEIYTYKRLKYFDRLYRETKSLAEIYGFKSWKNLNPVHMETFKNWLSGKNGLSFALAKFAIKEAIKRKKDGQPSLKYIEDNFINPWKKANIKNIGQAKKFLNKKIKFNKNQQSKKNKLTQWNDFSWNFNDFQEA